MSARDPLHELKDALSFPVSPEFCARVRQQVAREPVPSPMFGVWRLSAAAAVVLAAAIGVIATLQHRSVDVPQVSTPRIVDNIRTSVPARDGQGAVVEPARVVERAVTVVASHLVSSYETVVPDDQLRALDRLLAAMREGRATVPPVVADGELNDRGERVLRALVIAPVTVELLAGTPAEPVKNPVKDPNK